MRGKELDTQIEHELQLMLIEGFDKSPISAKRLAWQLSMPPLPSPLSHRVSSTVMLCLVHCTNLMPHFRYLQKVQ